MSLYQKLPIKAWALEDRPREKLLERGQQALTDAELVAILLGSGFREHSALDLARHILTLTGGLEGLARSSVAELVRIKGVGEVKALTLLTAFELGRRKRAVGTDKTPMLTSAAVADYLAPHMGDLNQEVFYVLFLSRNHTIKASKQLFQGGVSATIIDTRIVMREAIHHLASAIILAHNHPSGNLRPSRADREITQKLIQAGRLIDVQVLDHLILTNRGYYSFNDEGLMAELKR